MNPAPDSRPEPPWEALEALAADELAPAEARALRTELQGRPDWARAYDAACAVEARLQEEALLPVSLPVLQRVLDATLPARRERPLHTLGRVAAAVLVFCAAWWAHSGAVPAMADVLPRPEAAGALAPPLARATAAAGVLPAAVASPEGPGAPVLLLGGLALLLGGLVLTRRWHGRAPLPEEATR